MIPARAGCGPRIGHCSPCCKPRLAAVGTRQGSRSPGTAWGCRRAAAGASTTARQRQGKLWCPSKGQTSADNIPALLNASPRRVQIKSERMKKKSPCPGFVQAKGDSVTGRDLAVKIRAGIFYFFIFNMFMHAVALGTS